MWNKVFNRLPDNYSREGQINNAKLHQIIYREYEEIRNVFEDIRLSHDIDNAKGKTLDYIGKNVLQYRGIEEDDELYRLMIKTKIIANLSQGDIETINEVATVLLGDSYVGIKETWSLDEYNYEPAGLVIDLKPKFKQLPIDSIKRTIAGGVGVKWSLTFSQDGQDEIYLATVTLTSEETTVYPYTPKDILIRVKTYIGAGHNTGVENVTVYPKEG